MSDLDLLPIILQNNFQYKDKTYRVLDLVTNTTRRFNRICTKDIKNMNYIKYIKLLQQIKKLEIETLIEYDKIYAYKKYILLEMHDYPHSLSVIDTTHYFNESNIIDILMSICKSNMSLHEKNIVNGNIHPNNILIEGLNVKVSDYCKNTLYGSNLTLPANKIAYTSPETIANKKIDVKSDVWSIGCIFYYILTNKHAFESESVKKTTEKIINNDYQELNCNFSKLYNDLLKKILQIIPSNRITLKELEDEIEKVNIEIKRQSLHQSVADSETTEDKKKLLNEYLLQKISKSNPNNSSEIVEIILKMDILDILKIIDTPSLLEDKIRECIEQLNNTIQEEEYTISSIVSPQSSFSSYSSSFSPLLLAESPPLTPLQPQSLSPSLLSNATVIEENTDKWRNCYFKNFPKSWSETDLIELFSKYGGNVETITVKDGFGYVYFETYEEAKRVIDKLNGKTLSFGSKPFYICKYISKSIRKLLDEQSQFQSISPLVIADNNIKNVEEFSNYLYQSVVQQIHPDDNPTEITRMLLEMNDVSDILLMINNPVLLKKKILELIEKINLSKKETQHSHRTLSKRERKRKEEIKIVQKQQQRQVSLSQQLIANATTVDEEKDILGDYIYQRIYKIRPDKAAKITGMLLELKLSEIIFMIDNPGIFEEKIQKALALLDKKLNVSIEEDLEEIDLPKPQSPQSQPPLQQHTPQTTLQQSLSHSLISNAKTVDEQKKALSEYLYYNILTECPEKAPQLTGMILEMDISEILLMTDNPSKLKNKIKENLTKLNKI